MTSSNPVALRVQPTLSSWPLGGLKAGEGPVEDIQAMSEKPSEDKDIPF